MAALPADVTLRAFEQHMDHELGVVRISLGLASDFQVCLVSRWRSVVSLLAAHMPSGNDERAHCQGHIDGHIDGRIDGQIDGCIGSRTVV